MNRAEELIEIEKAKVAEWNGNNIRGQKVLVRFPDSQHKEPFESFTLYDAFMFYGHAVCYVNGIDDEIPIAFLRVMMPCLYCQHELAEPFPFETGRGEAVCQHCGEERNMH